MKNITLHSFTIVAFCVLIGLALIGSVAAAQTEDEISQQAIFYPNPPSEPKLQFLKQFSSALDLSTTNKGFRDFVFGGEDKEAKLVEKPYGAGVFEGSLYVVDARGNGYAVFDVANNRSRFFQPKGAGALIKPINITIDKDGTRYITDTGREQILVYDSEERFLKAIGSSGQFRPVDVAIADDRLYVTDILHHQVHILDKQSGEVLSTFGGAGAKPGEFFHPTNLALGPDGTIYVTDTTNFRIQQFTADGEFIRTMGSVGAAPGTFSRPKGVAVDRDDNIYVVDSAFENVQILAPDGGARMAFGRSGNAPDNINLPTVVKIDYDNVSYFERYAAPGWEIEYLVIVANQYGPNKVVVFGFGQMRE
jgi:DNA-binding beta-propeller fold protein YncE